MIMTEDFYERVKTNVSDAIFSENRDYRYALWRIWDRSSPNILVIMLNPSTANGQKNDSTVSRLLRIARNNGYGGLFIANLYAFITSNPDYLKKNLDKAVGPYNNSFIQAASRQCEEVCFAWGNYDFVRPRVVEVTHLLTENWVYNPKIVCLGVNKNGSPKHPSPRNPTISKTFEPLNVYSDWHRHSKSSL